MAADLRQPRRGFVGRALVSRIQSVIRSLLGRRRTYPSSGFFSSPAALASSHSPMAMLRSDVDLPVALFTQHERPARKLTRISKPDVELLETLDLHKANSFQLEHRTSALLKLWPRAVVVILFRPRPSDANYL